MQLTFEQCFGASATQDIDSLVIVKAELPKLTPDTNNRAEALVVGILLKILENFQGSITDENGNVFTTENDIPITYDQGDIVDEFYLFKWRIILRTRNATNYKIYQFVFHQFDLLL